MSLTTVCAALLRIIYLRAQGESLVIELVLRFCKVSAVNWLIQTQMPVYAGYFWHKANLIQHEARKSRRPACSLSRHQVTAVED